MKSAPGASAAPLLAGTSFAAFADLDKSVNLNKGGWIARVRALDPTRTKQWVYLLEDRNAGDANNSLRVLKAGQTAANLLGRIGSGGEKSSSRTWALHRQALTMHLFEVNFSDPNDPFLSRVKQFMPALYDAAIAQSNKADTTAEKNLNVLEDALRAALYAKGYRLPEDHTGTEDWRNKPADNGLAPGVQSLKLSTTRNTKGTLARPPVVPGLGGD